MDAYTSFAAVYDTFMDNIPYEEWKSYLKELLKEYGVQDGLVLDLGCGTGTMKSLIVVTMTAYAANFRPYSISKKVKVSRKFV